MDRPLLYRTDKKGQRFYYELDPEFKVYPSVTTVLRATTPMAYGFLKWYVDQGSMDDAKLVSGERAEYGTFMHIMFNEFLIRKSMNMENLHERIADYVMAEGLQVDINKWEEDLANDLASFAQFVFDREVEPIEIEWVGRSTKGYAGALDLVCKMTFNKKRITAIVDYKSGRKGFYDDHKLQLAAYWQIAAEHEVEVDNIFNFAPKDWREKPTYSLTNWDLEKYLELFNEYLKIYKLTAGIEMPTFKRYSNLVLGEAPEVKVETLKEIIDKEDREPLKPVWSLFDEVQNAE